MTKLRFVDEPPPREWKNAGRKPKFQAEAAQLRAQPGKWAILAVTKTAKAASGMACRIKSADATHYPALLGCEAVSRTVDDEHRVYVRWPEGAGS